jgi:tRNA A37 threonylcarbamoyladenosine modification protein TsaB
VAHNACLMTDEQIHDFIEKHPGTVIAGDIATPDEDVVACCAKLAANADVKNPDFLPRPLYLREPDVTLPSKALTTAISR